MGAGARESSWLAWLSLQDWETEASGRGVLSDGPRSERAITHPRLSPKHHRFVADSKDKEPEVVFIGDSLVQLMHQCEVRPISLLLPHPGLPS